jgi:hypothetical protein
MTLRVPAVLAASVATLALAAGATAATTPPPSIYVLKQYGYSIILPSTWYPIPRTEAAIRQTIANYKAEHNTSVAGAYAEVLASPMVRSSLSKYTFQAFLWPPLKNLVPTEVAVQVVRGHFTTADLTTAGDTYAQALSGPGSSVRAPQRLTLRAGPCELVEATINNGSDVTTGAALYIFAHAGSLYVVSFEIDGALLHESSYVDALRELANTFSYKTS